MTRREALIEAIEEAANNPEAEISIELLIEDYLADRDRFMVDGGSGWTFDTGEIGESVPAGTEDDANSIEV